MTGVRRTASPPGQGEDAGTAVVEFVLLAVLLLVPMVYVVLVVFRLQSSAYALAAATRAAGRAFITAPGTDVAQERSVAAAAVAMRDHGVPFALEDLQIDCHPSCQLTPGTAVTVRMATEVALPLLPDVLGGDRLAITVNGIHVEYVDRFVGTR